MPPAHNRKLREAVLDIGGSQFHAQINDMQVVNDTDDAEQFHTYGGDDSSFAEPADPNYNLALKGFADWRVGGFSDFLWVHDGETVTFQLDHHPNIVGEHVRWSGQVNIKAPNAGGEIRTTELTESTLKIIGKPAYARIG